MLSPKLFLSLICLAIFISCESDISPDFELKTNASMHSISVNETLTLSIENKKNHPIDSVSYSIDGIAVNEHIDLTDFKLGQVDIEAKIYSNDELVSKTSQLTLLSGFTPKIFSFNIINEYPHDITSYTQGLEFFNGELYESSGQYGESKLRKVDYKTGEILKNIDLDKQYFAEGLTIINNNIHQLTWQEGVGFTYDLETFKQVSSFKYNQSKEGWGICNDGRTIYKSDGTEKIWKLDAESLAEKEFIQTYHSKGKIVGLNELEWVNGKIYANRYQLNGVAIINPKNGAVEGVIDFTPLRDKVKQHDKLDVLNGIAFNAETQTIFVTGKYWDKLFEVEIIEK